MTKFILYGGGSGGEEAKFVAIKSCTKRRNVVKAFDALGEHFGLW